MDKTWTRFVFKSVFLDLNSYDWVDYTLLAVCILLTLTLKRFLSEWVGILFLLHKVQL